MHTVTQYFNDLSATLGAAWNRFWFTPTSATTLGVLRIATGLLALYTIATYAPDLQRWFAADGMLPMSLIRDLYRPEGQFLGQRSLLDYLPDAMLWPAYWTSLAVLALYTLGVGGRAIVIAATVVTISFFTRGPLLIGELEHVLVMLMIYLCIGRACDTFTLLSLWKGKNTGAPPSPFPIPHSAFNTISVRLIQVHIAVIHLMMAWSQLAAPEAAWWSGEGVWLAIARPEMSLVDLSGLIDHPRIVAAWSHAITLYLLAFPVLVWKRLARPLVLVVGACVWISFAIASGYAPFCVAMLTGLAAFIEPRRATTIAAG
jgi:hypothetical protein